MSSSPDNVPTLATLDTSSFSGTPLAVLGWPVRHSLSPQMHNAALAALAGTDPRFSSWHYEKVEVRPEELARALELLEARGFKGVNLTVPHKVLALGLVDDVAPGAKRAGAVNTLLARKAGGWRGFNTDGYGLSQAVEEAFGRGLGGRPILLLGAGGAARAAAAECLDRGCASLALANRTVARCEELVAILKPLAGGISLNSIDPASSAALASLPQGTLVINATSLGLEPDDAAPIRLAQLPRPEAVFDMIYNPPETALLREAAALGLPRANGLGMLVHQGAKSLEVWTGVPAERTAPVMAAALKSRP